MNTISVVWRNFWKNETDPVAKSLLYLARAVQYRLYFDFKSALDFLNKVKTG
jgi:hypothetical protein